LGCETKSMTDRELFRKSHETLIGIMELMNKPVYLVERSANVQMESLAGGANVVYTDGTPGVTTLHHGLPQQLVNKVVETFLDSHRKI